MAIKMTPKSVVLAAGATLAVSLATAPFAQADTNPFGMNKLSSGYMTVAEGKCGEGKCGGKAMPKEGKCGGKEMGKGNEGKCGEGKCGGDKAKSEAKCGGNKGKTEGKCGEGKCGGSK